MQEFIQFLHWDYILGGFALFLFGIYFMGEGLKNIAGEKLHYYIHKYTDRTWKGMIVGAAITFFIQSSSATTAIVITFVRANLLSMRQAIGVIVGANIGTTTTALLIGLHMDQYALYFIFLGVLLLLFTNRNKLFYAGQILIGFGTLFLGCSFMGNELYRLQEITQFEQFAQIMKQQPLLGLLSGTLMTSVVQSSSVVISMMQNLYSANVFSLAAALPFVFGSNIGTTITAVLAAIGGNKQSKQTAFIHVCFNLTGGLFFMILMEPCIQFLQYIQDTFAISSYMTIAIAHVLFNVTTAILIYPFLPFIASRIEKYFPAKEEKLLSFDEKLAHALPTSAFNISKQACVKMGEMLQESMQYSFSFYQNSAFSFQQLQQSISSIHKAQKQIADYLIRIIHQTMAQEVIDHSIFYLQTIKTYDHITSLLERLSLYQQQILDQQSQFNSTALKDMEEMFSVNEQMLELSLQYLITQKESFRKELLDQKNYLDLTEEKARQRHFRRLSTHKEQDAVTISLFIDMISTLKEIGSQISETIKK